MQIEHIPYEPMAYPIDSDTVRLTLRITRDTARTVEIHYGDRYEQELADVCQMRKVGSYSLWDIFLADVPVPTRRLKYVFAVITEAETVWFGERSIGTDEEQAGVFQVPYICVRDLFYAPRWVGNTVAYQIFPERFENGNPLLTPADALPWDAKPTVRSMHGGDLPGITQRLKDLSSLGVNLIYLTPIFSAKSNHKYDTTDYFQVDAQFGTISDLRQLVQCAHQWGIRVVLDAVFNHTGEQFSPFQEVVTKGKESPYWNWFYVDGDEVDLTSVNYETFANKVRSMPKLNIANPEVEQFLLDVATFWIQECDIDGWRLDVANEVDHVFWRKFRTAVKAAKADALIVGEVWHDSLPWLRGDEFDGVMNYLFRENTLDLFIRKTLSMESFAQKITELLYRYSEPAVLSMFNLLGSHDTERLWTLANGRESDIIGAFLFQFLYPGIPMLYYGDEVGMEGGVDPDCRRGMIWDPKRQNSRIQNAIRLFAHLKQSEPALAGLGMEICVAEQRMQIRRFVVPRVKHDFGSVTGKDSADREDEIVVVFDELGRAIEVPTDAVVLYESGHTPTILPGPTLSNSPKVTQMSYAVWKV